METVSLVCIFQWKIADLNRYNDVMWKCGGMGLCCVEGFLCFGLGGGFCVGWL